MPRCRWGWVKPGAGGEVSLGVGYGLSEAQCLHDVSSNGVL